MKKAGILFIFLLLVFSSLFGANGRIVIDSVWVKFDYVTVGFHANQVIDAKIAEGLRKGRTCTLEYRIQLWGKKSGLLNQMVTEYYFPMKVYFDFWENKFVILTPEEKRLTPSIETVRTKCTEITAFEGIPLVQFNRDMEYTFVVELIIRPLSVQNYQEIKNWLSGEAKHLNLKDADKQAKGFGTRLLRMLMALTGFGDRVISARSSSFQIQDGTLIFTQK